MEGGLRPGQPPSEDEDLLFDNNYPILVLFLVVILFDLPLVWLTCLAINCFSFFILTYHSLRSPDQGEVGHKVIYDP